MSTNDSDLQKWVAEAERLEVAKNLLYFNQGVGLKFDKRRLALLEKKSSDHAEAFTKNFRNESRPLFLMSVDAMGKAKTFKYQIRLHEARTTQILSKDHLIDDKPVNWGSWRQFSARCSGHVGRWSIHSRWRWNTNPRLRNSVHHWPCDLLRDRGGA